MKNTHDRTSKYQADSLSLVGAVALGTGVMIGAGIFALTGQMAEMTGSLFPLAFLSAALIVSFSAYSYVKLSNAYPSAGGIAMYLEKAYGRTLPASFYSLLMYFSMVIAQSFLARTFGSYTLQLFEIDDDKPIIFAFHGYPSLIHQLTYRRTNHANLHVRGYKEEGTTTTPFDMTVLNDLDRFHLVADVIDRVPQLGPKAASGKQLVRDKLIEHKQYIAKHGEDLPEIRNWRWSVTLHQESCS